MSLESPKDFADRLLRDDLLTAAAHPFVVGAVKRRDEHVAVELHRIVMKHADRGHNILDVLLDIDRLGRALRGFGP